MKANTERLLGESIEPLVDRFDRQSGAIISPERSSPKSG
jgi:hypothetical protein